MNVNIGGDLVVAGDLTATNMYNKDVIEAKLLLKQDVIDVFTKTEINNILSNGYYNQTVSDDRYMLKDNSTLFCEALFFQNIQNSTVDILTIKGGTGGINFISSSNVDILGLTENIIDVHVPLKVHQTTEFVGDVTALNLYTKTEVNNKFIELIDGAPS